MKFYYNMFSPKQSKKRKEFKGALNMGLFVPEESNTSPPSNINATRVRMNIEESELLIYHPLGLAT